MNPFQAPFPAADDLSARLTRYLGKGPTRDETAYVHPRAVLVGDVTLGPKTSVWPCAVLRGDIEPVSVGEGSNIQDGAVVHVADGLPARIGAWVTVGHLAMIHACEVGDGCLIGMHATLLDGCKVGARSIVGAGALVTKGTVIPPGSLVLGSPAKVVRALTAEEQAALPGWAEKYVVVAAHHRRWE